LSRQGQLDRRLEELQELNLDALQDRVGILRQKHKGSGMPDVENVGGLRHISSETSSGTHPGEETNLLTAADTGGYTCFRENGVAYKKISHNLLHISGARHLQLRHGGASTATAAASATAAAYASTATVLLEELVGFPWALSPFSKLSIVHASLRSCGPF
jgi:hypothetical protein